MSKLELKTCALPSNDYAYSNMIYLHPDTYSKLSPSPGTDSIMVNINGFILSAMADSLITDPEAFGLNVLQRNMLNLSKMDIVTVR